MGRRRAHRDLVSWMAATSERIRDGGAATHRRMAGDAGALRAARKTVGEALAGADAGTRETAVLAAGELVTNALVHGGGWFLLDVHVDQREVRVEVTDASAAQPRVLRPDMSRQHGRGMAIVDAVAERWGTDHRGSHKVVWFVLPIDRA